MKKRAIKLNDDTQWHAGQRTIEESVITDGDLHMTVMIIDDNTMHDKLQDCRSGQLQWQ